MLFGSDMAISELRHRRPSQWLLFALALFLVLTAAAVLWVSAQNAASMSSIRLEAQKELLIFDMVTAVQVEAELVGAFAGQIPGMEAMGSAGAMESMAGRTDTDGDSGGDGASDMSEVGLPQIDISEADPDALGDDPLLLDAVTSFEQAAARLGGFMASSERPALDGVLTAHIDFVASIAGLDVQLRNGEDAMFFYHSNTQLLESALRTRLQELQLASSLRLQSSIEDTASTETMLNWALPVLLLSGLLAAFYLLRLHNAKRRIETLEHLVEVKGEFIAAVSHELRTPLTAVVGFAEVLRKSDVELSSSDRLEMIDAIANQSADVTAIIDDLLVAARNDIGGLEVVAVPVDLRAQTAQVLESLWPSRSIGVSGQAQTSGDPARVRQILRNLITNAIRYGGDVITVELGSSSDAFASLIVKDDGEAIPTEDQERIFEPYERAHHQPQPGSIGLGLAVSRQLARLMGGDLTYRHQDGYSIFELFLPVAAPTDLKGHRPGAALVR